MRACNTCGETKAFTRFPIDRRAKQGVGGQCKACRKVTLDAWRRANPGKTKAYTDKWRDANTDKVDETSKAWRVSRAAHRRASTKAWIENNRARHNANVAKRRAVETRATPAWADATDMATWYEVAAVLSRSGIKFQVDHIVPLNSKLVCGLHNEFNFQVIPGADNLRKGNRHWPGMP